jgi:leucyl aminopeptidase (aminopeptidase T)
VLGFERDTMSHSAVLNEQLAPYPRARRVVLRAISSSPSLFADALRIDPDELTARNAAILERVMTARTLHITTQSGSDLDVRLDNERHRWISNRGAARPGAFVILPAGEVATYPAWISGVLVADFAFNVNAITDRDARLEAAPVTVRIEDGRAVWHRCADPATDRFLDECFTTHCASNVGELGFGTNRAIDSSIAMNSHINERRPGVHIGFGQHNQAPGVVPYQCAIHLDLIARGGTVWVDDDPDPIDLEHLQPSVAAHPCEAREQDVFSPEELDVDDCCGILTADGLRLFSTT